MAELEPFSDSCDDFELALLRSMRRDTPAADAATKTLIALGLGQTSASAAMAAGAPSSSIVAHSSSVGSILKGLAVGLLAGGGIVLVVDFARETTKPPPVLAPVTLGSAARPEKAGPLPAVNHETSPQTVEPVASTKGAWQFGSKAQGGEPPSRDAELGALPRGEAAFAAPPETEPSGEESPSKASLAEQVGVIDAARRAVKSGRASAALGYTRNYDQRWPSGPLSIEAVIVRIEAELALGDRASAEREARRVLHRLPDTRYAARVRQLFSPPLRE